MALKIICNFLNSSNKISSWIHEFHLKALFAQVPSIIIWFGSTLSGNIFKDWKMRFVQFWVFCFIFGTKFQYRFRLLNLHVRNSMGDKSHRSSMVLCNDICHQLINICFPIKEVKGHFLNSHDCFIFQSSLPEYCWKFFLIPRCLSNTSTT